MDVQLEYVSVGGNLNPSAADWDASLDVLAWAAGVNIALWRPNNKANRGVCTLLKGHYERILALKFLYLDTNLPCLLTGSSNSRISLWALDSNSETVPSFSMISSEITHAGSINCFAATKTLPGIFVSGSSDKKISVWQTCRVNETTEITKTQTITLDKPLIANALALQSCGDNSAILAIGGTASEIWLYSSISKGSFICQTVLRGHEGWIRALEFTEVGEDVISVDSGVKSLQKRHFFLASASQDKYVRIWKVCEEDALATKPSVQTETGTESSSPPLLTNKLHQFQLGSRSINVSFEALLVGHDDWVYTARWSQFGGKPQLLTSSADNTVTVWMVDRANNIWYAAHRLGDLSAQKGSTSATGTSGGLWNGLWSPKGDVVVSLARSGSWHKWVYSEETGIWKKSVGTSGHIKAVRGVSWAQNGSYLLSTSEDQTTRLHSEWKRGSISSWHEFSRPQIHGYDLNCIGAFGETFFVSGADEKLLRVFEEPDDIAHVLQDLCHISAPKPRQVGHARIPVLGLSNKSEGLAPQNGKEQHQEDHNDHEDMRMRYLSHHAQPPSEDDLARNTLWPETEKLYGHGFEVNALAVSHDNLYIATSCKASSPEHAVIRIFRTSNWQQIMPPLKSHTLSVTSLRFSLSNEWLLSVGRDRKWVVWEQGSHEKERYIEKCSDPKAHSRMILSATWLCSVSGGLAFATGGRDKLIKIWQQSASGFNLNHCIELTAPVISLATIPSPFGDSNFMATGMETGEICLYSIKMISYEVAQWSPLPSCSNGPNVAPKEFIKAGAYRNMASTASSCK